MISHSQPNGDSESIEKSFVHITQAELNLTGRIILNTCIPVGVWEVEFVN